ncbi:putative disease resistance protein At5g05400 [Gossypium arboreum]|uniref:putative disease resistance protein At5g05400 n=1 Tax=Gossypium arboreum TaxID=29729 RepID=UPI000819220A|nr:putative disease resistance protein At5g05400 [Gossypium arboreum]
MAGEFCLAAASNAVGTLMVDYLVKPIDRRIRYLFRFHKLIEDLHQQQSNLKREQTRVEEDVKEAKLQIHTQVIEDYVDEWLKNVDNALKDVQNLDSRVEENKRCFRWCPNWCWRYQLGKEIEKKTVYISKLVEDSHFERIGHRAELPGLEFFTSKDIVASKSSTAAFNNIMEALEDDKVNMIGVWGMGGVGKTTIVKEVGKKTKELGCFRKVIEVVVPKIQSLKIFKIKQQISCS